MRRVCAQALEPASAGMTTQAADRIAAKSLRVRMRPSLVPRIRSSHDFAVGAVANFGFKGGTRIIMLASVLFDSEVRPESAANACDLRNRDTGGQLLLHRQMRGLDD